MVLANSEVPVVLANSEAPVVRANLEAPAELVALVSPAVPVVPVRRLVFRSTAYPMVRVTRSPEYHSAHRL